jgi:hypothetical protein
MVLPKRIVSKLRQPDFTNPYSRPALLRLIVCYLHSNPDLGLHTCHDVLGRSGLKESKQEMGMATEFQSRSRHGPVLRRRTPKLSLEPQEIFSCTKTSTKINLAQLRSARIQGDKFCLRVTDEQGEEIMVESPAKPPVPTNFGLHMDLADARSRTIASECHIKDH